MSFETSRTSEASRNPGDFGEIRKTIGHRLFYDASYGVFDAMSEMTTAAEAYITELAEFYPEAKLWVGGSLGRREMLPNSDIDLFVIYDNADDPRSQIRVEGVDKFEIGHIDTHSLHDLLMYSLVDANRFIDGRRLGNVDAADVEQMVINASTPDRQLANNISEYFYYRYFDFPQKTLPIGPNLKYSTGSSRDTIFFNMISRMFTSNFPAIRGPRPELEQVMADASSRYGIVPPYDAVNMLFTVKNAAISVYDATSDPRSRYVSSYSLESIYQFAQNKFAAWGIKDSAHFVAQYSAARQELEIVVDTMFTKALSESPVAEDMRRILETPGETLLDHSLHIIESNTDYPHSLAAFASWQVSIRTPSAENLDRIANALMKKPLNESWGGLMAVACCAGTSDATLSKLADWLYTNEKGAYLTKLITRNKTASPATREKAAAYYRLKEIII